uniref:Peptidase M12A domain-containing protein n=1 Tax=Caenorhabditis tropicalis TaxID=1561998 RepID=A0A1I7TXU9_9PELO
MASTITIPVFAYKKYEITSLINRHASHCEEAVNLWYRIDRLDYISLADQNMTTFNFLMEDIESYSVITDPVMGILSGYLASKDQYYVDRGSDRSTAHQEGYFIDTLPAIRDQTVSIGISEQEWRHLDPPLQDLQNGRSCSVIVLCNCFCN